MTILVVGEALMDLIVEPDRARDTVLMLTPERGRNVLHRGSVMNCRTLHGLTPGR